MQLLDIQRVYQLPDFVFVDGEPHTTSIKNAVILDGAFWVIGEQVLLRSTDGFQWQDVTNNLRHEGCFFVSSIVSMPAGICIAARSRNGLIAYVWDRRNLKWERFSPISSGSPGVLLVWTNVGLIAAGWHELGTEIINLSFASGSTPIKTVIVPGIPVHLQVSPLGIGICATWGINETIQNSGESQSGIFFSKDLGSKWDLVGKLNTHLLSGAPLGQKGVLVGGSEGVLARVSIDGIENIWKEEGGDIVAVDVVSSLKIALLAPDDEALSHHLLLFENGAWEKVDFLIRGRVQSIKGVSDGDFLIFTRDSIYRATRRQSTNSKSRKQTLTSRIG